MPNFIATLRRFCAIIPSVRISGEKNRISKPISNLVNTARCKIQCGIIPNNWITNNSTFLIVDFVAKLINFNIFSCYCNFIKYFMSFVIVFQSSVRKGTAGNPSLLNKLHAEASPIQANRTAIGCITSSLKTTTLFS